MLLLIKRLDSAFTCFTLSFTCQKLSFHLCFYNIVSADYIPKQIFACYICFRNSNKIFSRTFLLFYQDKLDFLKFDSKSLLYPSHSVVVLSFNNSFIVCNFASVISARLSAIASARAGFFGEPYSSSP